MLQIDASKTAPKIAQVLSLVGWGVPSLNWAERRNVTAKTLLEENEDGDLFEPQAVNDEAMATGVRALLYVWTGWPGDGQMWAAAAPEKEKLYISALAHRQSGQIDESKSRLQQLQVNPLSDGLARLAKELINDHADDLLVRFRDLVDLGQTWEAFAFTDLLEQARDGEFSHSSQEIIRQLQWLEFNMLFQRCYERATGVDVTKRENDSTPTAIEPAWKRNQVHAQRARPPASASKKEASEAAKEAEENEAAAPTHVGVKCPKCKTTVKVEQSARGHTVKCGKCANPLRVAPARARGEDAASARTTSRLICPKCRNVASYAMAHRGKKVACLKCRTSFLFAA